MVVILLPSLRGPACIFSILAFFIVLCLCLLLLLLDELVPVMKLVGDVAPSGGLSVAEVEGIVYLRFEHFPHTLRMNCTLIL